jgi:hypothetical protein
MTCVICKSRKSSFNLKLYLYDRLGILSSVLPIFVPEHQGMETFFKWIKGYVLEPGLPDGIVKYHKYQFW